MKRQHVYPKWLVAPLALALIGWCGLASAQQEPPGDGSVIPTEGGLYQVEPADGVVGFRQIVWKLELASIDRSNWGELVVDPVGLAQMCSSGRNGGTQVLLGDGSVRPVTGHVDGGMFLNVLLYVPGSNLPQLVAANMSVPAPECGEVIPPKQSRIPLCKYIDLMPNSDEPYSGRILWADATVLLSAQPIPTDEKTLRGLMQIFKPRRFLVGVSLDNSEGMLPDPELGTFPPRVISARLPLGFPPDPIFPGAIDDLVFPICVYQDDAPNFQCAKNQCVPMGQANTIQYLEDRYNGPIQRWRVPQLPIPGYGMQTASGDVVYWVPVPMSSLVANVDFFTRRTGVYNADSGGGATICQLFRGLFGYLELAEPYTLATFRHQGTNSPVIGDGATCDTSTIVLGGRTSTREGEKPTFSWIFNQLQQGRGVSICFGRYDVDGNRTSGHCVRVWGACSIGSKQYLYTLDDGNQGSNNVGLRTQTWDVADTGSPGNPGVPDGRMNMDGMSWEIEFANSIQPHPTAILDVINF